MRFAGPLQEAKRHPLPAGMRGGMIIFSTDVNATLPDAKTALGKARRWLEGVVESFRNRFNLIKKIHSILQQYDKEGVSIGPYFRGYYRSDSGRVFSERSIAIEMAFVDSETLEDIATEIAEKFKQETVMVKDYNTNEIYFADREDVRPTKLDTTIPSE